MERNFWSFLFICNFEVSGRDLGDKGIGGGNGRDGMVDWMFRELGRRLEDGWEIGDCYYFWGFRLVDFELEYIWMFG